MVVQYDIQLIISCDGENFPKYNEINDQKYKFDDNGKRCYLDTEGEDVYFVQRYKINDRFGTKDAETCTKVFELLEKSSRDTRTIGRLGFWK